MTNLNRLTAFARVQLSKASVIQTLWSFATRAFVFIAYYLLQVYLVRSMSVSQWGEWSFFFAILNILCMASMLGISTSTMRYVAQYVESPELMPFIRASVRLRVVFSLAACIILGLFHSNLCSALGRPELSTLLLWSLPLIFFVGLVEHLKQVFNALHRLDFCFVIHVAEHGFKGLLVVILFSSMHSLTSVTIALTIACAATALLGLSSLYWRLFRDHKQPAAPAREHYKKIISYGAPLFLVSLIYFVSADVGTIILGMVHGDEETAIYSTAKEIFKQIPQISFAISLGTMPVFAKLSRTTADELRPRFYKIVKFNLLVLTVISIGFFLLADTLIPMIFGERYIASGLILKLSLPYCLLMGTSVFTTALLTYAGEAKALLVNMIVFSVSTIGLSVLLIPPYGAEGAAIAVSGSAVPYALLNWRTSVKALHN
ncbi:MAG: O-antigen/teichoic acid export membrane protein [Kiritimatiellia bacterium]|jgi:O-antigen/teichoic acid export membrane protein